MADLTKSAAVEPEVDTNDLPPDPPPTVPINVRRYGLTRHVPETEEDSEPKWGTAQIKARMDLILVARDNGQQFVFGANQLDDILLGRYDPDTGLTPQVDLESAGGTEKGVSRRHAKIIKQEGMLHVVDIGSHNGTYLNGQRLVPNQPRILRDGDDLRLGYMVLRVQFA